MKKIILFFITFILTQCILAQNNISLIINHKLGKKTYTYNQSGENDLGQKFKISRVDYYISKISIIHDGGLVTPVPEKYILVKGDTKLVSELGLFNIKKVEGIKFHIGVDPLKNTSDPTLYKEPHPLALKSPSMHWGWASGYRFVTLEGNAGINFNTKFELHGLFDQNYFEQTIMVKGKNSEKGIVINLKADYNKALKGISVKDGPISHGINKTDLVVLTNFKNHVFLPD
jgi:hypothetical protein